MKIYARILSGAAALSLLATALLISKEENLDQAAHSWLPGSFSYEKYRQAAWEQFDRQFMIAALPASTISTFIIASWYGPGFHGRLTASGETFNMHARTCAHKTHAFGTKLKIVNLLNNKRTECIVNDRGPYIAGRDLDLSHACAEEIGLIEHGTGMVRVDIHG